MWQWKCKKSSAYGWGCKCLTYQKLHKIAKSGYYKQRQNCPQPSYLHLGIETNSETKLYTLKLRTVRNRDLYDGRNENNATEVCWQNAYDKICSCHFLWLSLIRRYHLWHKADRAVYHHTVRNKHCLVYCQGSADNKQTCEIENKRDSARQNTDRRHSTS